MGAWRYFVVKLFGTSLKKEAKIKLKHFIQKCPLVGFEDF
jgi:hypothetical protein